MRIFNPPPSRSSTSIANSYRVLLDPDSGIIWETVRDGQTVRYRDEPGTGFRRRSVADLLKLLPIDLQL